MKRLFALGLALLLCGCALAEEPELTEAQSALLEYAMQKQSQYIELILSDAMDSLWDTVEDEKETRALFEQIRPAAPKAAILLTTKAELFKYYKQLYIDLGLYETYKLQIYSYLVASAKDMV